MGGCAAIDAVSILRKSRQELYSCEAEVEAERADSEPEVFTRIHLHFILTGEHPGVGHIERTIQHSAEKYCSALIMPGKMVRIMRTFEIRER